MKKGITYYSGEKHESFEAHNMSISELPEGLLKENNMKKEANGCMIVYLLYLAESFWLIFLTLITNAWWIITAFLVGAVIYFLIYLAQGV